MSEKTILIVIDGCAAAYISKDYTPHLYEMGKAGFYSTVKAAMPSVTNVNHASILSGKFPDEHGVLGNYYYDRQTGKEGCIETSQAMKTESVIDVYRRRGKRTALLTVKGKVLDVFGRQADIGINLQRPEAAVWERLQLEAPPQVASLETYEWIFKACYQVLTIEDPDFIYCTTNDYMMHHYAPDSKQAHAVMQCIDRWIGKLYEVDPGREIYITADHGMNPKSRCIDLQKKLAAAGYKTFCLLPLKDRYIENHPHQEGGAAYVYVWEEAHIPAVLEYMKQCDYIDTAYDAATAAGAYHLPVHGIGDILAFCSEDAVFAELDGEASEMYIHSRTHGSLYERDIPLIAVNARRNAAYYTYTADIVRAILEDG